jgi:serine/threonine protein phosphatase PrpC
VLEAARDSLQEGLARVLSRDPSGRGRATIPVTWASSAGLQRKENQDRVVVGRAPSGLSIAVLADGMGGLEGGGRAAVIAASAVAARALRSRLPHVKMIAEEAIHFANEEVFRALRGKGGAAVVLAVWSDNDFAIIHAGDARAYSVDLDGLPVQLTTDDTVAGQLERLGHPSERPLETDRGLLQFVGVGRDLELRAQGLVTRPRVVILTSDGVHNMPNEIFRWVVQRSTHLQALADRLVQLSDWNGGADNATAICIGIQNGAEHRVPEEIECWVPGLYLVFSADRQSVAPSPQLRSSPPAALRPVPTPEPKSKKKGLRLEKKGIKKTKRASGKPPAPLTHSLPIEVTFEPGESSPVADPPADSTDHKTRLKSSINED